MRFDTIDRVTFRSVPEWYTEEERGKKPFTIRAVRKDELSRIALCDEIEIVNTDTHDSFFRAITFVRDVTDVLPITLHNGNDRLIIIQWEV